MLERTAYAAASTVKWLVFFGSVSLVALIMTPDYPVLAIAGLVLGAARFASVAEALGVLLAALAVRAGIREFRFGPVQPAIRFRVRDAQVSLGLPFGYWMNQRPVSTVRHAVILLGGPLTNLALAGIVQAFPAGELGVRSRCRRCRAASHVRRIHARRAYVRRVSTVSQVSQVSPLSLPALSARSLAT